MRVLLLSPVPRLDPPCGDVTYTEELLANPPPGVEYETYDAALESGRLVELRRRSSPRRPVWTPSGVMDLSGRVAALGEAWMRRRHVLFREPFRWFRVQPGAYDLVHCHVFSCRLVGSGPPVVISNAIPIEALYRDALGWPDWRVRFSAAGDHALASTLRVAHSTYRPRADRVIAFTDYLANWWIQRGLLTPERVDVIPPAVAVSPQQAPRRASRPPRVIGFVAKDFFAKGGSDVVAAFAALRQELPDAELVIVGSADRPTSLPAGARWLGPVPRNRLLGEILPRMDVLAYPTRFDGLPLTVVEALALGIPVITSDYAGMPQAVNGAGMVVTAGDRAGLAAAMVQALDSKINDRLSQAAERAYRENYRPAVVGARLRATYDLAMGSSGAHRQRHP